MALNPAPHIGLAELWKRGVPPLEACQQHAEEMGYAIGSIGWLTAALNSFNSIFQFSIEKAANSNKSTENELEKSKKIMAQHQANELKARNWLIHGLNSGRQIAIGRRIYPSGRSEWRYVWDGRLSAKQLNWFEDSYAGPARLFRDIRILFRSDCPDKWLKHFDRLRIQGTGRPRLEGIDTAIERVATSNPKFDPQADFKEAVYLVQCELQEMQNSGHITQLPKQRTIEEAIRAGRRNSK